MGNLSQEPHLWQAFLQVINREKPTEQVKDSLSLSFLFSKMEVIITFKGLGPMIQINFAYANIVLSLWPSMQERFNNSELLLINMHSWLLSARQGHRLGSPLSHSFCATPKHLESRDNSIANTTQGALEQTTYEKDKQRCCKTWNLTAEAKVTDIRGRKGRRRRMVSVSF